VEVSRRRNDGTNVFPAFLKFADEQGVGGWRAIEETRANEKRWKNSIVFYTHLNQRDTGIFDAR